FLVDDLQRSWRFPSRSGRVLPVRDRSADGSPWRTAGVWRKAVVPGLFRDDLTMGPDPYRGSAARRSDHVDSRKRRLRCRRSLDIRRLVTRSRAPDGPARTSVASDAISTAPTRLRFAHV